MSNTNLQHVELTAGSSGNRISVKCATSRSYTIRLVPGIPLLLCEYPNISSSAILKNGGAVSRGFFQLLLEQSPHLKLNDTQKPVPVNGKWVYIFRKAQNSVSLVYEVKPVVNGTVQEFEYVSWKSGDSDNNRTAFPRKTTDKKLSCLDLDVNKEYYFLLSRIQLPLHRIDFYTQNPEKLALRAVLKKIEKQNDDSALVINLVDFIAVCFALVAEKDRAVTSWNKYFDNEDESTKRYLANMITAIEKNRPEIRKWLDFDAVIAYGDREEIRAKRLLRVKESTTGRLKDWKLSEGYKQTRDDYNGVEAYEKEILEIESAVTAEDEVQYLAEIGGDDESWYHKVFMGDEPFLFHRKLAAFGAFDELPDLLCKYVVGRFLSALPATAPKIYYTVETIIEIEMRIVKEFETILKRMAIKLPELTPGEGGGWFIIDRKVKVPRIKYKLTANVKTRAELDFIDSRAYDKAIAEWKNGIEKASVACKSVLLVIETMNLVFAAKSAYTGLRDGSDGKGFDAINAAGSFADSITATEFLLKNRSVQKITTIKSTEKTLHRVNLVGSICDYIGALKDIYAASSDNKNTLAISYSVIALASGAGMVSSAIGLGATGTAFGIGLSATGVGAVAVALFLAGATLVWIFTEEEIEEWAKESEWGSDLKRRKSIQMQLRRLHEIICAFKADCYFLRQIKQSYLTANGTFHDYFDTITLRIRPGMLHQGKSRFIVTSFSIVDDNGLIFGKETVCKNALLNLPDEKTQIVKANDKEPGMLLRRFSEKEMLHVPDFKSDKLVFSFCVQLDLQGDGSELYPAKPLEIKGDLRPKAWDRKDQ